MISLTFLNVLARDFDQFLPSIPADIFITAHAFDVIIVC